MITAPPLFRDKILNGEVPSLKLYITYADASSETEIPNNLIWGNGVSFSEATSEESAFTVGSAIIGAFKFSLNNFDGDFDNVDFSGSVVRAVLYFADINKQITKGTFYITNHTVNGHIINITAMDAMKVLDMNYTTIEYPITVRNMVIAICNANSLTLDSTDIPNGNFVVSMPVDTNGEEILLTDRQKLSYACQCIGCFARMRENNKLKVDWYDFDNPIQITSTFDGKSLWTNPICATGVRVDLGNRGGILMAVSIDNDGNLIYMRSSEVSDTFTINSSGELIATADDGTVYTIVNEELIRVGEQFTQSSDSANESINILYGTDEHVIKVSGNPFITINNVALVCKNIAEQALHILFRPGSLPVLANPCLQAGDVLQVTDNITGNVYYIPVTSTIYNKSIVQTIHCAFESADDTDLRPNANYKIQRDADAAARRAELAETKAETAQQTANNARSVADDAVEDASVAQAAANAAQISANNANEYASRALNGLASVQSVAETLAWVTAHGTMTLTSDTELDPTHVYFVRDTNGDYQVGSYKYSIVVDPDPDDLSTYYVLAIDESLNNYVATHLAVTSEGLWILPAATNTYKVLIATGNGTAYTTPGTYIIDANGAVCGEFSADGMHVERNGVEISHLGYGNGVDENGNTLQSPYYTLGTRKALSTVGVYSFARGREVVASGADSFASGSKTFDGTTNTTKYTTASGYASHAEGLGVEASGDYGSHAEGFLTVASGTVSHSEGQQTTASGDGAHAEGKVTTASAYASHAEGYETVASQNCAHAQGLGTIASSLAQSAVGKYNVEDSEKVFIVGNGSSKTQRSNAFAVGYDGSSSVYGTLYALGRISNGTNSLFLVREFTLYIGTMAANAAWTTTGYNIGVTGYKAISIAAFDVDNDGGYCVVPGLYIGEDSNGDILNAYIWNQKASAVYDVVFKVKIFYIASSAL